MGSIRQDDAEGTVKKKSKKRKNAESSTSRGEEGDVEVCDVDLTKKARTEFLVDNRASGAVSGANYNLHGCHGSRKEKKKKDRSSTHKQKEGEKHAREDVQVKKNKKKTKTKEAKGKEVDCVSEKDSAGSMGNQTESEVIEKVEPVADKKKEKKKDKREEEGDFVREEQAEEDGQAKKNKKKTKRKGPETREVDCGGERDSAAAGSMGNHIEPVVDKKKKKKKEKREVEGEFEGEEQAREDGQAKNKKKTKTKEPETSKLDCASEKDSAMGDVIEPVVGKKKKKKTDKREEEHDLEGEEQAGEDGQAKKNKKNTKTKEPKGKEVDCASEKDGAASMGNQIEPTVDKKKKKKKKKKKGDLAAGSLDKESGNNGTGEGIEPSNQSGPTKRFKKKVTFSDHDEVVTLPDTSRRRKRKRRRNDEENGENGLVQGKRFSKEEDEIVKRAVLDYVEEHQLGEDGVDMIMKCKQHREIRGCWREIAKALPYRPIMSVYYRAHILFEGGGFKKWTPEDFEIVRKFHAEHGPDWKTLADELGTHRFHVKDAWRRIKLPNLKKGHWSQDEYQNLFNLVNLDLSMKIFQEKKSKHGMLRDNISWEAISDKLSTRTNATCCVKWYDQLSSPMVAEGKWSDSDDYRLLMALVDLDPSCEDEVDWDQLLDHRPGDVCRERWKQMVRHIGHHATKSFGEQIEILSARYCPEILEAREAYENKPYVD